MKENKISWARVSKNICYFIAPIFGILLIACIAGLVIMDSDVEMENTTNYYDTKIFSNSYLSSICNHVYKPVFLYENVMEEANNNTENDNNEVYGIEENSNSADTYNNISSYYGYDVQEGVDINGKSGIIYYNTNNSSNFKYLMIDTKNAIAITNLEHTMRSDTVEKIKGLISENSTYWNFNDGVIDTNISNLSIEEIKYTSEYEFINNSDMNEIYTSLTDNLPYKDDYAIAKLAYDLSMRANTLALILIPTCIAVLLALGLIILNGIGKKGKGPGIHTNGFDRIPLEIAFVIGICIAGIGMLFFATLQSDIRAVIFSGIVIGSIIIYLSGILLLETIVKRMKTHTLWKTTLLYMIGHSIKTLIDNRKITTKLMIFYWGFCIIGFIATMGMIESYSSGAVFFWFIILAALGIGVFWYLFKKIKQFQTIQNAIKAIYEGNTDIKLDSKELTGVLKQLGIYIEDIAGGLSNAINESLKSERLKTELITNVSHDIKTPLTSIINYVDLLKKEKMPNEKATEYLMILENKSQRLKKLTEDLVEASKASSGNIKLKMEKIDVKELIKQISGEFEDRFKSQGLEEVMTLPEEQIFIKADGRYIYRVLENLYSNISKYALENTRVYVDVVSKQTSVVIQMKNISKEELNITTDELMQRFVRGDSSRNTEGSGLGLSIASSLTELQGGKFHIYLDGDLFKVTLGFDKLKD